MIKGSRTLLSLMAFLTAMIALAGLSGGSPVYNLAIDDDLVPADTGDADSLPYPINGTGGLYLDDPSNYKEEVEYDEATGQYVVTQKIGNLVTKPPMFMTPEEYSDYVARKQASEYWEAKTQSEEAAKAEGRDPGSSLIPQLQVNSQLFKKIFGSNTIDIRPQGYAELRFGGRNQKIDNPLIPERNRSTFTFDFDQRIQMNVTGKVGEKLSLATNYDTEATFSFENQTKLEYTGDEDDIIKKIELGNVSMPLNSSLISGAQSLFGVKGQFQFGKLTLTGVLAEQQSQSSSINVQGGATTTNFEISADQYEANRHYFLSQYFRSQYERVLSTRPLVSSPVQITKVEVWVTNTRQSTESNRNIVAFMDLGEMDNTGAYRNTVANLPGPDIFSRFNPTERFPDNGNNSLNPEQLQNDIPGVRDISQATNSLSGAGYEEAIEFTELSNARKLTANEFRYDPQLGFISLTSSLDQDEVLAVAFQFTAGGRTFQVGEFSTDGVTPPKSLIVKMLKSTILNVKVPMWDLMMKNVYSLNAFQVNQEDFRLEIQYRNDETGTPIPFLPEGNLKDDLLVRVTGLDKLNSNNDPQPDGFFDFIPNITINTQTSRIFFPVLEPFGSDLAEQLDEEFREQYVFQELYDSTRFRAQNETQLNKFLLKGQFKSSSSSEISLNAFNIPQGSVRVSAGGQTLQEGVHYTVDYNLGRVKIIDDGILASGTPIKVDFENNAVFNFQTRNFMGVNADYRFNENLNVGATLVRLSEKPLTQKVNIGAEPIANTMWGMNGSYSKEAPYLTRFVDAIPFIETKEKSNITLSGEFAQLIPGSPRGIEINGEPTTYLDDFESSQTTIDIKNPIAWRLASTPANQPDLFPEASFNGLEYGFNRALLAWYTIDPLFHREDGSAPSNINQNKELQSGQFVRRVYVEEVFPNIQLAPSDIQNVPMLDLAFFPNKRGPYNFDVEANPGLSAGINQDGDLNDPESRWGGIMRDLSTTNFEEQNIEFIQFWVMDPYTYNDDYPDRPDFKGPDPGDGGYLYINLGSVSEDILKDGQQSVENGIPSDGDITKLNETDWGYVPKVRPAVVAFDNEPAVRTSQDVGYDLLSSDEERTFANGTRPSYLDRLEAEYGLTSPAYQSASNDPAFDDFQYYRGNSYDQSNAGILDRYLRYNNTEGNSNTDQIDGVSAFATNQPDVEDINRDQTLSKTEAYFQYKISMKRADLASVGQNYITDIRHVRPGDNDAVEQPDGKKQDTRWIQFKVPVFTPDKKVGPVSDFRSIRFIRMFMQGWGDAVVLRFAKLELVRGEWRRYAFDLDEFGDELNNDGNQNTLFDVNAVSIEQNGSRLPIPYKLPPGIDRQVLFGTTAATQQNEQSLSLRVCELEDGSARAVFRNLEFDMRNYNRLKMFVHAEDGRDAGTGVLPNELADGDLTVFIRMGSDYNQNYYEYELPLKVTKQDGGPYEEEEIWPSENDFDFKLDLLKEVKLERDRVYRTDPAANLTQRYSVVRGNATVSVVGAPNLSNVRTMMIGVRNPKKRLSNDGDDGQDKCAEIWVNELRLTEFDQRGGWAANARVAAQLADFANVSLSGSMSTIGFGSIDQTVSERQKETMYAYDFQSSFEIGKFFPKDAGIRIPMFFGSSEQWSNPQFNPIDPDIEFDDALANLEDDQARAELREISQDYTRRRSINFTNVKKERTGKKAQKKPMPWDVENLSATYSYTEIFRRNISVKQDLREDHRGQLNYTYRIQAKPLEPFKNVTWLQNKNLELIKSANLYYLPKQFSVIGSMDRTTHLLEMRNTDDPFNDDARLPVTENNTFNFNRQYSLLYDITRNLKLDFNANMRTRIDELVGIDEETNEPYTDQQKQDEIKRNLGDFGRPTNYHQTVNINWQVPINKLPLLDFINTQARYTGDYDWSASSLVASEIDSLNFANTIQNNQQWQFNNNFNMLSLYNKVPYLKKVNEGKNNKGRNVRERGPRTPGQNNQVDPKAKDEDEETTADKILATSARVLMMVRNASANYSRGEGTILPGFLPEATYLGMSSDGNAPGFAFVFGGQTDIQQDALDNNWITSTPYLSTQYSKTFNENMNFRVTVEPVAGLRIILSAQKTESANISSFFRFDEDAGQIMEQSRFETQNYSISYFMMGTSFENLQSPSFTSEAYEQFRDNRLTVSQRLAEQYANGEGQDFGFTPTVIDTGTGPFYDGYSLSQQQVLIPAFLAAYSGKDINSFDLNPKRSVPLPNWNLTYDGLGKIKWFQQFFTSVILTHGYRSTYTIGNLQTNLLYDEARIEEPQKAPKDINGDILPELQISSIVLSEQYAPLIGFNVKLKNSATLRLEYKKDRNLTLGLANNQITETKGQEWVIGAGYIIKDVKLSFINLGPRRTNPVSNLELKLDFGIRENLTVIRRIIEDVDQVTAGQRIYTLKFSADYQISKRVLAKLFYDMNLSRYEVSNAYPIDTHQFGISVRLNLGT